MPGPGSPFEPTAEQVTRGLRQLLECTPEQRSELGRRGRTLVEAQYTWDRQAERLEGVYRWLAGGGPAPAAVVAETL